MANTIGEHLARALKAKDLAPAAAAGALGISRSHMGDLLTGRRKPTPKLAVKIERVLGVPAERISPVIRDAVTLREARAA